MDELFGGAVEDDAAFVEDEELGAGVDAAVSVAGSLGMGFMPLVAVSKRWVARAKASCRRWVTSSEVVWETSRCLMTSSMMVVEVMGSRPPVGES